MPDCVHHWRLTTPNGPTVQGECKRCGAERVFSTTDEGHAFTAYSLSESRKRGSQRGGRRKGKKW